MKAGLTLMLVGCSLTVVSFALLAQEPVVPGAPGGVGPAGGRGRGGGGFVTPTYDKEPPVLPADLKSGGVLIYSKTNGFRDEAGIQGPLRNWRPLLTNVAIPTSSRKTAPS